MAVRESIREVFEGKQTQGEDEEIVYTIDVSKWGDSPSSPSMVVKEETDDYEDVTSVVAPSGSVSAAANVITLPTIKLLTAEKIYRVEVKFTMSGNVLETYIRIRGER